MSYLWNKITNSSNYGDFCNHNFYENDEKFKAFKNECSKTGTTEESIAQADKIGLKTELFAINPLDNKTEVPVYLNKKQKELLEQFREIENEKSNPSIKKFFQKAKDFWKN